MSTFKSYSVFLTSFRHEMTDSSYFRRYRATCQYSDSSSVCHCKLGHQIQSPKKKKNLVHRSYFSGISWWNTPWYLMTDFRLLGKVQRPQSPQYRKGKSVKYMPVSYEEDPSVTSWPSWCCPRHWCIVQCWGPYGTQNYGCCSWERISSLCLRNL